MRLSRTLLVSILAAPLVGQIPYGSLLVGLRNLSAPGLLAIDPATGLTTPVFSRAPNQTMTQILTVAVDPTDPLTLHAAGGIGGLIGSQVWPLALTGNLHPASARYTTAPSFGFPKRFHRFGKNLLMTISGGTNNGLIEIDLATKAATKLPLAVPNFALDIAVIGAKAYVNSDSTPTSSILEYDPAAMPPGRTVGSNYPPLKSLATRGGLLLAGTGNGQILLIVPATGASVLFLDTGITGAIPAIAVNPDTGEVFFAVVNGSNHQVYRTTDLTKPIFSSTAVIGDMDIVLTKAPTALFHGTGCPGSNSLAPQNVFGTPPKLGGSFQLGLEQARSSTPVFLTLGNRLPGIDLGGIQMPGCFLYDDLLLAFGGVTDQSGTASMTLPVPGQPAWSGARIGLQWIVSDPGANSANLVTSEGAEAILR